MGKGVATLGGSLVRTSSAEIKCPLVLRRTAQPRFHLASVQPPVLKSLPRTLDTRNWTLSTTVLGAKKYKLPSRFKKLIDYSLASRIHIPLPLFLDEIHDTFFVATNRRIAGSERRCFYESKYAIQLSLSKSLLASR